MPKFFIGEIAIFIPALGHDVEPAIYKYMGEDLEILSSPYPRIVHGKFYKSYDTKHADGCCLSLTEQSLHKKGLPAPQIEETIEETIDG